MGLLKLKGSTWGPNPLIPREFNEALIKQLNIMYCQRLVR